MEQRADRPACARLDGVGLLQVSGADARAFLHAQLTSDIESLAADRAVLAGWCSAKGRLLATFLVVPWRDQFLLQVARDLAPTVAQRLAKFVLRAKVSIADASAQWSQWGVWAPFPGQPGALHIAASGAGIAVQMDSTRYLLLAPLQEGEAPVAAFAPEDAARWRLAEIRAGRPTIEAATQDQFIPQMVNLDLVGGVDFQKGCYPGQEIVARARYRGEVKRRLVRARAPRGLSLRTGQDLFDDAHAGQASGTVLNVAPAPDGEESLAVAPVGAAQLRAQPGGPVLEILPLPYPA